MSKTVADRIWNRAAQRGGDYSHQADCALASLLLVYGLSMNGGIHHAVECLSSDELTDAINGFAYFGFDDVGKWLWGSGRPTPRASAVTQSDR